jgi:CTP:phosphocholine cytidylyltransferase-like protein
MAAGLGSRMSELTKDTPKGLVKVKGVPMLENQIQQLHEADIKDIIIVVGYLREKFDYLVEKYGVKLIYNPEFSIKNNLASLYCAKNYLGSSYILSSDNWIKKNMFHKTEPKSWTSCAYFEGKTNEWCVTYDKDGRITKIIKGGADSLATLGPVYFTNKYSKAFKKLLVEYYNRETSANMYWEDIVIESLAKLPMYINDQSGNIFEFDTAQEVAQFNANH